MFLLSGHRATSTMDHKLQVLYVFSCSCIMFWKIVHLFNLTCNLIWGSNMEMRFKDEIAHSYSLFAQNETKNYHNCVNQCFKYENAIKNSLGSQDQAWGECIKWDSHKSCAGMSPRWRRLLELLSGVRHLCNQTYLYWKGNYMTMLAWKRDWQKMHWRAWNIIETIGQYGFWLSCDRCLLLVAKCFTVHPRVINLF